MHTAHLPTVCHCYSGGRGGGGGLLVLLEVVLQDSNPSSRVVFPRGWVPYPGYPTILEGVWHQRYALLRNMGLKIPCEETHACQKHYLPATSLEGGNKDPGTLHEFVTNI